MENYFILLELPFDPPESDTDKILRGKQAELLNSISANNQSNDISA